MPCSLCARKPFAWQNPLRGKNLYMVKSSAWKNPLCSETLCAMKSSTRQNPLRDKILFAMKSSAWQNPLCDEILYVTKSSAWKTLYTMKYSAQWNPLRDKILYATKPSTQWKPLHDKILCVTKPFAHWNPLRNAHQMKATKAIAQRTCKMSMLLKFSMIPMIWSVMIVPSLTLWKVMMNHNTFYMIFTLTYNSSRNALIFPRSCHEFENFRQTYNSSYENHGSNSWLQRGCYPSREVTKKS
jgi:hypothetical protein